MANGILVVMVKLSTKRANVFKHYVTIDFLKKIVLLES